jgi:hypothetical protein
MLSKTQHICHRQKLAAITESSLQLHRDWQHSIVLLPCRIDSSSKPGHQADPSDPASKPSLSKPSMMIYPIGSNHSLVVDTTSSQVTVSVSTAGA